MADVHRAVAEGFGRHEVVTAYERARPSFPPEAVEFLIGTLQLERRTRLADLGAGTGKLTRLLAATGSGIIGVEPVDEMRRAFAASLPWVPLAAAVAEALPFRDETLDGVVAAQAFHWFDGVRALAEIHRALRPGGRLALVWNRRDERVPWVKHLTELIEPFRGDAPAQASLAWKAAFRDDRRFTELRHVEFPYGHRLGIDGVADRVASVSFVAVMSDDRRVELLDKVRALAAEQPQPVVLPYRTHVYWTERQ